MKIAVCVKSAVDEGELRADSSGRPQLQGAASKMSTFDRNAVEEAVRQKEKHGGTVAVITAGGQDAKKVVKEALAMGGDEAVFVPLSDPQPDALAMAYLLSRCVLDVGGVDLIFCSEGASDTYQGQIGAMLAEFLDVAFLAYGKKVDVTKEGKIRCEQAFEENVQVGEAALPAVVSVISETNEPRYPTLLQIMQASKKPFREVSLSSLAAPGAPVDGVRVASLKEHSMSRKKVIFEGPPEEAARKLIDALKREGVL